MKIVSILAASAVMMIAFAIAPRTEAQPSQEYLIRTLDLLVDRTLLAYNREDYISFYEYFAEKMDPVTAQRHFESTFLKTYKERFGSVMHKTLLPERSDFNYDYPEVVYVAGCEKKDQVLIVINFANQYDNYRITRVRFDEIHDTIDK